MTTMPQPKIYLPLLQVETVLPILQKIAIFAGLAERELFEVFRLLKTVTYEDGEYIYLQGDAPSHIYIVKSGEVKIVRKAKDMSLELISFVDGDCFGETSVIGIQPHSSSAVSVGTTDLIVLERAILLDIFESDKALFGMLVLNIARETARRLQKTDEILADYVVRSSGGHRQISVDKIDS